VLRPMRVVTVGCGNVGRGIDTEVAAGSHELFFGPLNLWPIAL